MYFYSFLSLRTSDRCVSTHIFIIRVNNNLLYVNADSIEIMKRELYRCSNYIFHDLSSVVYSLSFRSVYTINVSIDQTEELKAIISCRVDQP